MNTHGRKKNSGIYKWYNTSNGFYYIGSSADLKQRKHSLTSQFRRGTRLTKAFKKAHTQLSDWKFEILEFVPRWQLLRVENKYLKDHISLPLCLNDSPVARTTRGRIVKSQTGTSNMAKSFVGKNRKPGRAVRSAEVVFLRDGERFVVSNVAQFAKQHGVSQSSLNALANGDIKRSGGFVLSVESAPQHMKVWVLYNIKTGQTSATTNLNYWADQQGINRENIWRLTRAPYRHCRQGWTIVPEEANAQ